MKQASELNQYGLSKREIFFMKWAYEQGFFDGETRPPEYIGKGLENGLMDVISDSGHVLCQKLVHDAPHPIEDAQQATIEKQRGVMREAAETIQALYPWGRLDGVRRARVTDLIKELEALANES